MPEVKKVKNSMKDQRKNWTREQMITKVEQYIAQYQMIPQGTHIVAGVSGGADSLCLFLVLQALSAKWNWTLHVVHVNHLLRGADADRDQHFVQQICEKYGVSCRVVREDVAKRAKINKESLEEAGRKVRYEAFAGEVECLEESFKNMQSFGDEGMVPKIVIAVAHHGDDQAETVLHHLIRGSSLKGVGGIRPVHHGIVRPLLGVTRKEIEEYLRACHQEYCVDATNASTKYTRNRLRVDVIPYLRENVNADVVGNVCDFAGDLREAYDYIHQQAEELLPSCRRKCATEGGHRQELMVDSLKQIPGILRREIWMLVLKEMSGSGKDLTRRHIEAVDRLLSQTVSKRVDLPYNILVRRDYDSIVFERKDRCIKKDGDFEEGEVTGNEESWFLNCVENDFEFTEEDFEGNWENITNDYTKVFDYDTIKDTLKLRKRMPGDYFVMDETGRKKSLKAFFIDEKIPRDFRDRIWLLAEGSHILWIVGYRISAAYKTNPSTRKALRVTVRRNNDGI